MYPKKVIELKMAQDLYYDKVSPMDDEDPDGEAIKRVHNGMELYKIFHKKDKKQNEESHTVRL